MKNNNKFKQMKTMKTTILSIFLAGALFFFITGCDSSEDPALSSVSMKMTAKASQSGIDPNGRMAATDTLIFTDFLLGITELEFETPEENEDEVDENGNEIESEDKDIEFEGVFIVDLLKGTSNPDFGIAALAPGKYSEIEMEMEAVLDNSSTITIKATKVTDNVEQFIEFTTDDDFELEIERSEGFYLTEGSLHQILMVIDLDALFTGVDFSNATADNDGVIRINENSNTQLAEIIKNNLEGAFEAGEDDDDDDEIDD
jgi:hypothetical protein